MTSALDSDEDFRALLDELAPRGAPSLLPELSLHTGDVLEDLWERLEALAGRRLPPPFWAFVWPGGQAVARYLLDHPERVAGRRVLDVATGDGVIALATAMAGGEVVANDIDPLALRLVRLHAALHGVRIELHAGDLLDRDPATLPFDLITVGDAFYEQPFASRLERWLRTAREAGIEVLLGDPGRSYLPTSGLLELAGYPVETTREIEGRTRRDARVFQLERSTG